MLDELRKRLARRIAPALELEAGLRGAHPHGHFYSPVVDPAELDPARLYPADVPLPPGIDFDEAGQREILQHWFPRWIGDFDYPRAADTAAPLRYYLDNPQFGWLDARALFVLLRQLRPRRMVEIGSGYSSLLGADVNQRFLGGTLQFECVEPYPREFLRAGVPGLTRLHVARVQDLPLAFFDRLEAGDVLFIDSSHVVKTGNDCWYLYLQVLPRLRPGVWIHIHDIALPAEYPAAWVLEENRSWNEQYLLQALLCGSSAFRVRFGCNYAWLRLPELVRAALPDPADASGGGSFWIERV